MLKQISKITKTKPKSQQCWDYKLVDIDFHSRKASAVFADGSTLKVRIDKLMELIPTKYLVDATKQLYITH